MKQKRKRYVPSYKTLFYYKPYSQYFTYIHPDDFLNLAAKRILIKPTGEKVIRYNQSSIDTLTRRMAEGKPIDPVFLDFESERCRIVGHEGRHRAVAAKKVGIDKMPLILFCRGPRGGYQPVEECMGCLKNWRQRLVPEDKGRR